MSEVTRCGGGMTNVWCAPMDEALTAAAGRVVKGLSTEVLYDLRGSGGPKPVHVYYFVLDWVHDPFAIPAALAYAAACEATYPELARDLRDLAGAAAAALVSR